MNFWPDAGAPAAQVAMYVAWLPLRIPVVLVWPATADAATVAALPSLQVAVTATVLMSLPPFVLKVML